MSLTLSRMVLLQGPTATFSSHTSSSGRVVTPGGQGTSLPSPFSLRLLIWFSPQSVIPVLQTIIYSANMYRLGPLNILSYLILTANF